MIAKNALEHRDVIARDDRPRTPFHLDPPCRGRENHDNRALSDRDDLARRAGQLAAPGSRVIPSLNDVPEVRRLFARHDIETVKTTYYAGGGANIRNASEVPISGP